MYTRWNERTKRQSLRAGRGRVRLISVQCAFFKIHRTCPSTCKQRCLSVRFNLLTKMCECVCVWWKSGFWRRAGRAEHATASLSSMHTQAGTPNTSQSLDLVVRDILCPPKLGLSQHTIYKITPQSLSVLLRYKKSPFSFSGSFSVLKWSHCRPFTVWVFWELCW